MTLHKNMVITCLSTGFFFKATVVNQLNCENYMGVCTIVHAHT